MSKIKAIIFDYDGVIAESVNVKTEAFAEIYRPFGKGITQKVIEHHEANGGVSRFEKFRIYHKSFLGKDINHQKVDELAKQFSDLVLQKVIESPYVIGAYDFITSNYKKFDLHISTGTPTTEIETILKRKDIRKYFKEVFGSPEKKDYHVRKILDAYRYDEAEVVFVGDALTDRDAARVNGVKFIGRHTTIDQIKEERYLITNILELESILKNLHKK